MASSPSATSEKKIRIVNRFFPPQKEKKHEQISKHFSLLCVCVWPLLSGRKIHALEHAHTHTHTRKKISKFKQHACFCLFMVRLLSPPPPPKKKVNSTKNLRWSVCECVFFSRFIPIEKLQSMSTKDQSQCIQFCCL